LRYHRPVAKVLSSRRELPLEGGALRLAVVADTHGRPHPRAAEHLGALAPHHVLHAGDIGDLGVLDVLGAIAPLTVVRGNIDERAADLPDVAVVDVTHEGAAILTILMTHIAVHGPKLRAEVARSARAAGAGLVVCGHSHVPFAGRDRDLTVFNPGSIGPRRFDLPIVFGVIDVTTTGVDVRHVDCETGEPWRAPRRAWRA
jgi:putative phosphoesterase